SFENLFPKPLDIPLVATNWCDRLESANSASDILRVGIDILGVTVPESVENRRKSKKPPANLQGLPPSLRDPVARLLEGIKQAKPHLAKAVNSVPETARQGFLALNEWPDPETGIVKQEISTRRTK